MVANTRLLTLYNEEETMMSKLDLNQTNHKAQVSASIDEAMLGSHNDTSVNLGSAMKPDDNVPVSSLARDAQEGQSLANNTDRNSSMKTPSIPGDTISTTSITRNSTIVVGSQASLSDGSGDLCFGRLLDRHPSNFYMLPKDQSKAEDEWVSLQMGSSGIHIEELKKFHRKDPFPFFKLTLEIRRKIFKHLIRPFFRYDLGKAPRLIHVVLSDPLRPHCYVQQANFDEYLSLKRWSDRFLFEQTDEGQDEVELMPEEYERQKAEFLAQHEVRAHMLKEHPTRTIADDYHYTMICEPLRAGQPWVRKNIDYLLIEWLRQASHTSQQFKRELADTFWLNSKLIVNSTSSKNWHLVVFLGDRPTVRSRIKSLQVTFKTAPHYGVPANYLELQEWCHKISESLVLDDLTICFEVQEDDLPQMSQAKGRFREITAIRSLRVMKSFEVSLHILRFQDQILGHGDIFLTEAQSAEENYTPIIRELLLPDTLRNKPTEMEKYEVLRSNELAVLVKDTI